MMATLDGMDKDGSRCTQMYHRCTQMRTVPVSLLKWTSQDDQYRVHRTLGRSRKDGKAASRWHDAIVHSGAVAFVKLFNLDMLGWYCRQAVGPWHHAFVTRFCRKTAEVCLLTLEILVPYRCLHSAASIIAIIGLSITRSAAGGFYLHSSSNHRSFICVIARCCSVSLPTVNPGIETFSPHRCMVILHICERSQVII